MHEEGRRAGLDVCRDEASSPRGRLLERASYTRAVRAPQTVSIRIFFRGEEVGVVDDVKFDFPHSYGRWRPCTEYAATPIGQRITAFFAAQVELASLYERLEPGDPAFDIADEAFEADYADLLDSNEWSERGHGPGHAIAGAPSMTAGGEIDWR